MIPETPDEKAASIINSVPSSSLWTKTGGVILGTGLTAAAVSSEIYVCLEGKGTGIKAYHRLSTRRLFWLLDSLSLSLLSPKASVLHTHHGLMATSLWVISIPKSGQTLMLAHQGTARRRQGRTPKGRRGPNRLCQNFERSRPPH